jgi:membrane protein DedA with SNARE-associated domain
MYYSIVILCQHLPEYLLFSLRDCWSGNCLQIMMQIRGILVKLYGFMLDAGCWHWLGRKAAREIYEKKHRYVNPS